MRVSTNNQAMRVGRLLVSSDTDFEVEEIVCGGRSWGALPRETVESDREARERALLHDSWNQNEHLRYLVRWRRKMFTPPDPGCAIVLRGADQIVVVVSNRGIVPTEPVASPESSKICAVALGQRIDYSGGFREGDEAIRRVPSWNPSECQIEEYLEQVRRDYTEESGLDR